jgi:hypothetical protein
MLISDLWFNSYPFFFYIVSKKTPNKIQANIDKIYNRFVHLDNLPEDGLQCVLCVGHQFGKVDRYMFMSNKNKVFKPYMLAIYSF